MTDKLQVSFIYPEPLSRGERIAFQIVVPGRERDDNGLPMPEPIKPTLHLFAAAEFEALVGDMNEVLRQYKRVAARVPYEKKQAAQAAKNNARRTR